jgi:hypothetical protein
MTMFTGEELAAYCGRIIFRVLLAVLAIGVVIGWVTSKFF